MKSVWGLSDPGCIRRNNEDSFLVDEQRRLFLVADGMGGAQAGEHASRIAIDTVSERLAGQSPSVELLIEAFEQANRNVIEHAGQDSQFEGMGTTLLGLWDAGDKAYIASVGDSRAYLFEDGMLTSITEDQTWVNEVGRKLGLEESTLKTHPMRHVLTMAIGVSAPLRVHSYLLKPQPGCQILLCSDGLHGVTEPEEISRILAAPISPADKCNSLVEAAKRAGGPDNITVILVVY